MLLQLKLRIPSSTTALKWLFCFLTAVLASAVAFLMGVAISAAYFVRQQLVAIMALNLSLTGAYLVYGTFNTACACVAAILVLYVAPPASGSGLPVRAHAITGS
jgi:uncharacterized membrane protein YccC